MKKSIRLAKEREPVLWGELKPEGCYRIRHHAYCLFIIGHGEVYTFDNRDTESKNNAEETLSDLQKKEVLNPPVLDSDILLTEDRIDEIFGRFKEEYDICVALYKHVYPNWDDIIEIIKYPTVTSVTGNYIFDQFRNICKDNKPIPSALWFQKGFSSLNGKSVQDWYVRPSGIKLKGE